MAKKQVKPVIKPYLTGTWRSGTARRKGYKLMISILFVSFLYLLLGVLLSFDSFVLRILTSVIVITISSMYMFYQGANNGETDTAFSEIMYQHKQSGKDVVQTDYERCYHPVKGLYSVAIALIPYLVVTILFAFLVRPITYSLGVLPSWLETPAQQTHVSEALAYYAMQDTDVFISILRIIVRAMTMPFINVSLLFGTNAVLWAERLTPIWVSIAPLAYALGYLQGPKLRIKINTGIAIGMQKKMRKQRKERKARITGKKPEQLI